MTSVLSSPRAAEFLTSAADFLRTRPVEHNILLTNASRRVDEPGTDNLWAWVRGGDDHVVAAAMHTPPFGAYVSVGSDDAMRELAAAFLRSERDLPGAGGPRRQAEVFAEEWLRRTGGTVVATIRQGMYAADAVVPPTGVEGRVRPAVDADIPLLREWVAGFVADTDTPIAADVDVADRVAAGQVAVWVDGERPVSMAAATAPGEGVSRVHLVYTPPERRGHGYASACVAALTARELAHPGRTCMLYTDLANPTSNGIYQAVGFRRVAEAVQLTFG